MGLIYIFTGLLIGWIIGYRDVSVLYEAIRKKQSSDGILPALMVAAALFAGIMLNREGTPKFIAGFSRITDLRVGAVVSLSAVVTAWVMRRRFLVISVSHALIGSIAGWLLFSTRDFPVDKMLYVITVWLLTPVITFFLAGYFYTLAGRLTRRASMHIFKVDVMFQWLTLAAMVIAAYSLGANNSANVTGVFLPALSGYKFTLLPGLAISGSTALFILAGLSITTGFLSSEFFKKKAGNRLIFELSAEGNFSVLTAYALAFFFFSSDGFQQLLQAIGLPGYPLIPISTFHVLTAGLLGISYRKGFNIYDKDNLIKLPAKSILTPLIAGLSTFVLMLLLRPLIGNESEIHRSGFYGEADNIELLNDWDRVYDLSVILGFMVLILLGYFFYSRMKQRLLTEKLQMEKQADTLRAEKEFFLEELKYAHKAGDRLMEEVELKRQELEKFALQLVEKERILEQLNRVLLLLKTSPDEARRREMINDINLMINDTLNLAKERELFYSSVSKVNADFFIRIAQQFNNLTESDKRLIALIKLGLTSKAIATLSNISPKSVEMNRYRLRKKLNIPPETDLASFINHI